MPPFLADQPQREILPLGLLLLKPALHKFLKHKEVIVDLGVAMTSTRELRRVPRDSRASIKDLTSWLGPVLSLNSVGSRQWRMLISGLAGLLHARASGYLSKKSPNPGELGYAGGFI